jgi:hypothetical protein
MPARRRKQDATHKLSHIRSSPTARPSAALATPALLERLAPGAAVSARANDGAPGRSGRTSRCCQSLRLRSLRSLAVKGAASRLAPLGPVGPPLTAGPLRLDGNEGPLTRTSSKALRQRSTDVFRQSEYPHVASQRDLAVKTKPRLTRPARRRRRAPRIRAPSMARGVAYEMPVGQGGFRLPPHHSRESAVR